MSVGLSRQEDWSGLPFPSPGSLPHPGTEPAALMSLTYLLHLTLKGIRSFVHLMIHAPIVYWVPTVCQSHFRPWEHADEWSRLASWPQVAYFLIQVRNVPLSIAKHTNNGVFWSLNIRPRWRSGSSLHALVTLPSHSLLGVSKGKQNCPEDSGSATFLALPTLFPTQIQKNLREVVAYKNTALMKHSFGKLYSRSCLSVHNLFANSCHF